MIARISDYRDILSRLERRMQIIKEEMVDLKERYGDERRTELIDIEGDLSIEDLIADEEMVITISHAGYIKRLPMDTYRSQNRGGRGITGMKTPGRGFRGTPLFRLDPFLHPVLHEPRANATGSRSGRSRKRDARPAARPWLTCCSSARGKALPRSCRSGPSTTSTTS